MAPLKYLLLLILQDQKLSKLGIDPTSAKDFERPFKFQVKSHDPGEKGSINNEVSDSPSPKIDSAPINIESASSSEDNRNP